MINLWIRAAVCLCCFWAATVCVPGEEKTIRRGSPEFFTLKPDAVVAFFGGANVVAAQEYGHIEALLAIQFSGRNVRFLNLAWEGDTVYSQPRDLNFPTLADETERFGATVLILQFGQAEALEGAHNLDRFTAAYDALIARLAKPDTQLVLVTPPPFESAGGPLPNLAKHNSDMTLYADAIRQLAAKHRGHVIDLFAEFFSRDAGARLTENGWHWSPQGHARIAQAMLRQLGFDHVAQRAGLALACGAWVNPHFEQVRQAVIAKNRLWFDYRRPMNWAFLAGDRTEQPSSRDHRNPKIRWFPAEMEKFVPLIREAESRIETLSSSAAAAQP